MRFLFKKSNLIINNKFIIKLAIFLFFFSYSSHYSFAQIHNLEGTIKLKNGQSYSGKIVHFYSAPKQIKFTSPDDNKITFSPVEVKEINLKNGKKFMVLPFKGLLDGNRITQQSDTSNFVFQAIVLSEDMSLFSREINDQLFFYVSKNKQLYPLERITKKNDISVMDDRKSIGMLKFLMADRPDLHRRITRMNFNEDELSDLLLKYNKDYASYLWSPDMEVKKESNLLLFAQFNNYRQYYRRNVSAPTQGVLAGLQYYLSKESRYSVKVSLEYINIFLRDNSNVIIKDSETEEFNLDFRYLYDFYRSERQYFYLMIHIGGISKFTTMTTDVYGTTIEKGTQLKMKMWLGIGYELWVSKRIGLYVELNRIFILNNFPENFSLGIKYDFGKTVR